MGACLESSYHRHRGCVQTTAGYRFPGQSSQHWMHLGPQMDFVEIPIHSWATPEFMTGQSPLSSGGCPTHIVYHTRRGHVPTTLEQGRFSGDRSCGKRGRSQRTQCPILENMLREAPNTGRTLTFFFHQLLLGYIKRDERRWVSVQALGQQAR